MAPVEGDHAARAAAYNAKADPSAGVNADFKPEEMSQRELDLRKRLGQMRAQVLADPSKLDAGVEKTAEDTRQLEFEWVQIQPGLKMIVGAEA